MTREIDLQIDRRLIELGQLLRGSTITDKVVALGEAWRFVLAEHGGGPLSAEQADRALDRIDAIQARFLAILRRPAPRSSATNTSNAPASQQQVWRDRIRNHG